MSDESGAVLILVALSMVALIGFAALAVDLSALFQERRELQNGADAAALAVAKDCARTGCEPATAEAFADANAGDGASTVESVCGAAAGLPACPDPPPAAAGGAHVRVTTRSHTPGSANPDEVPFRFAPVLNLVAPGDFDGRSVRASATARWGSPASATTLPMAVSLCELRNAVTPATPLPDGPPFAGAPVAIPLHTNIGSIFFPRSQDHCPFAPAGQDRVGGVAWLEAGGGCTVEVAVGDWVRNQGGFGPDCDDALRGFHDRPAVVPVFDRTNGRPDRSLQYRIVGFAAFHVTGYQFWGSTWNWAECPDGHLLCVRGHFTSLVTSGSSFGGPDLGVRTVKLVA